MRTSRSNGFKNQMPSRSIARLSSAFKRAGVSFDRIKIVQGKHSHVSAISFIGPKKTTLCVEKDMQPKVKRPDKSDFDKLIKARRDHFALALRSKLTLDNTNIFDKSLASQIMGNSGVFAFLFDPGSQYFLFAPKGDILEHRELGTGFSLLEKAHLINTLPYHLIGGPIGIEDNAITIVMAAVYDSFGYESGFERKGYSVDKKELMNFALGLQRIGCERSVSLMNHVQGNVFKSKKTLLGDLLAELNSKKTDEQS